MRTVSAIARYLAGVIFLVFGLNGFLNFIPLPPPGGIAGQFMGAMYTSHYLWVILAFQVIAAVLLLVNRYVPLALAGVRVDPDHVAEVLQAAGSRAAPAAVAHAAHRRVDLVVDGRGVHVDDPAANPGREFESTIGVAGKNGRTQSVHGPVGGS